MPACASAARRCRCSSLTSRRYMSDQLRIAGELDDAVVEGEIRMRDSRRRRVRATAFSIRSTSARSSRGLRWRRVLRRAPAGEFVEHRAQLEDLVRFLDADLAHEHAAVLLEPDEARIPPARETPRAPVRATRRASRRPRFRAACAPAGKIAGEDHPLELALDERGQRIGLHQRDRMIVGDGAAHRRGGWRCRADCGRVARERRACRTGFQHVAIRRCTV